MSNFARKIMDRLQLVKRKLKYKQDKYFKSTERPTDKPGLKIELLKGPFKGIIYTYTTFNIDKELEDGGAQASFEIEILNEDLTQKQIDEYLSDVKFAEITGQILLIIIEEAIKNMAQNYYRDNLADEEDRESYFEEPVPRRSVRTKGSPVSEDGLSAREIGKDFIRGNAEVRSKVQSDSDS